MAKEPTLLEIRRKLNGASNEGISSFFDALRNAIARNESQAPATKVFAIAAHGLVKVGQDEKEMLIHSAVNLMAAAATADMEKTYWSYKRRLGRKQAYARGSAKVAPLFTEVFDEMALEYKVLREREQDLNRREGAKYSDSVAYEMRYLVEQLGEVAEPRPVVEYRYDTVGYHHEKGRKPPKANPQLAAAIVPVLQKALSFESTHMRDANSVASAAAEQLIRIIPGNTKRDAEFEFVQPVSVDAELVAAAAKLALRGVKIDSFDIQTKNCGADLVGVLVKGRPHLESVAFDVAMEGRARKEDYTAHIGADEIFRQLLAHGENHARKILPVIVKRMTSNNIHPCGQPGGLEFVAACLKQDPNLFTEDVRKLLLHIGTRQPDDDTYPQRSKCLDRAREIMKTTAADKATRRDAALLKLAGKGAELRAAHS